MVWNYVRISHYVSVTGMMHPVRVRRPMRKTILSSSPNTLIFDHIGYQYANSKLNARSDKATEQLIQDYLTNLRTCFGRLVCENCKVIQNLNLSTDRHCYPQTATWLLLYVLSCICCKMWISACTTLQSPLSSLLIFLGSTSVVSLFETRVN